MASHSCSRSPASCCSSPLTGAWPPRLGPVSPAPPSPCSCSTHCSGLGLRATRSATGRTGPGPTSTATAAGPTRDPRRALSPRHTGSRPTRDAARLVRRGSASWSASVGHPAPRGLRGQLDQLEVAVRLGVAEAVVGLVEDHLELPLHPPLVEPCAPEDEAPDPVHERALGRA